MELAPGNDGEASPQVAEESEILRLQAELDQVRDLLQRKQAEFENYRKRVAREREDVLTFAASELVKELLPVLDNLERALGASEAGANDERLREGIEIIYRQFREVLARAGMKEVEAQGREFDPYVHEAVSRVESDEHPDGTVIEVLQKGYYLKDRLLRPALVSVVQSTSGGGRDEDADEEDDTEERENSSETGQTVPSDAPPS